MTPISFGAIRVLLISAGTRISAVLIIIFLLWIAYFFVTAETA